MLPDFKQVKDRANRNLLRWLQATIPALTPLIQGVPTYRQHEGRAGRIVRLDQTESKIDFQDSQFRFELNREEMRQFDIAAIRRKLEDLAVQIGEAQEKRMLEVAGEAADSVGNVVHTDGELTPDKFLEVFRRIQMDFDPATLEPKPGYTFVMHPDMAAKVMPKVKEWERDSQFREKYDQILSQKREEWRDREANRKLVS